MNATYPPQMMDMFRKLKRKEKKGMSANIQHVFTAYSSSHISRQNARKDNESTTATSAGSMRSNMRQEEVCGGVHSKYL